MAERTALRYLPLAWIAACTLILMSCGNKNSAPQNLGTVAPVGTPMSESQRETNALPLSHMVPVPRSLHCSGAVVWANPARKNYHMAGDPYYGRTRHGQYMCEETATAQGYHPAGMPHHRGAKSNSMMQASPAPAASY